MIPFIQNAIFYGYNAKQILDFVGKRFNKMQKGIENSRNSGYSDDDILKFLGKRFPNGDKPVKNMSAYEKHLKNAGLKTPKERTQQKMKAIKGAMGIAGTALSAYNMYKMGQSLPQNRSDLIDAEYEILGSRPIEKLKETLQLPGQQPKQIEMGKQPPTPSEGQAIPMGYEKPAKLTDYVFEGVNLEEAPGWLREKLRFVQQAANKLEQAGKTPTDPEAEKLKSKVQELLKQKPKLAEQERERLIQGHPETEITLEEAATQLDQPIETKQQQPALPEEQPEVEKPTALEPTPLKPDTKIEKGEQVVTEDGNLATVKGISGHHFLIEDADGKLKQVPFESLRGQPEAIKKAKIVFDPSLVNEMSKSSALNFVVTSPDHSGIYDMYNSSDEVYLYTRKDGKPIDESIIKSITEGTEFPLSKGDTFFGAYDPLIGDSRGAANSAYLVKMSQDKNTPTDKLDPSKPFWVEKVKNKYFHGLSKEVMNIFREVNRMYVAKPIKPKKENVKKPKKRK